MEYLTVKEMADLKGCKPQHIRKLAKDGKLETVLREHPQNHKPCYMIPVSSLPDDLKSRYYSRLKKEAGTAPELKEAELLKPRKKVVKKPFEEYTYEERQEIALWCGIIREWQDLRAKYKKKTSV
ncbi:MAG: helix-turn-helix domain-containing protein, partial [Ruminococcus sp.]|nr:helix-turn-helix domain-containing protein [Ruminococcus sp.]